MSFITPFEDIKAWQEARKRVKMIYKLTNSGLLAKDLTVSQKQNLRVFWALRGGLPWKFNHCFTPPSILSMLMRRNSKSIMSRQGKRRH